MKHLSSFAAVLLAITFFATGEAAAQTSCGLEYACPSHESCEQVTERVMRCRRRCYTDIYCTCWRVLCDEYVVTATQVTWLGACAGSGGTLFCDRPQSQCDDPTLADCDDESEDNTGTPVVFDVEGNGFRLTSAAEGVTFDLDADGTAEALAWTEAGGDDAWLAFDRNGNGAIDDGTELFGDATPQPAGGPRNGYRALAVFDDDGNAQVDAADPAWSLLRLWRDADHDGVSQAWELSTLDSAGIAALGLEVKSEQRRDRYGNVFRYRAAVRTTSPGTAARWSYDVFLARPGTRVQQ